MEQDKRFIMAVMDNGEMKEVSILDTEEDNAQLFCCECHNEEEFFCKQEVQQVIDQLNFQDHWINKLLDKVSNQKERIETLEKTLLS